MHIHTHAPAHTYAHTYTHTGNGDIAAEDAHAPVTSRAAALAALRAAVGWDVPFNEEFCDTFGAPVLTSCVLRLFGDENGWLNDTLIEYGLQSVRDTYPDSVYCYNTFFYTRVNGGHDVSKWTKRINMFQKVRAQSVSYSIELVFAYILSLC